MEMAFNFLDHEFNLDQRSSTPKSSRSSTRHLFHSNESAILEIESSTSVVDRSKLKRRLFDKGPGYSAKHGRRSSTEASVTPSRVEQTQGEVGVSQRKTGTMLSLVPDVIEDPENQTWLVCQRDAFFEAVQQCGNDFVGIAKRMKQILAAKYGNRARCRCVADVQKYFLHIVKVVSDIVNTKGRIDQAFSVFAVVNFGEWAIQSLGKKPDPLLFKELLCTGEAEFPIRQKSASEKNTKTSVKIRTPNAPALRRLYLSDELSKLPSAILVRLRPRSGVTWLNVRRSGRSPLLCVKLNPTYTIKYLFELLRMYWRFERTEKKYLNAEIPELTLRPTPDCILTWSAVMPDFNVLFQRSKLCWLAYDRFLKRFPNRDRIGQGTASVDVKDEQLLCPDSHVDRAHNAFDNEEAVFYDNMDSDDEDSDVDITMVHVEHEKAAIVQFQPSAQYPEFFDDNRNVVWTSAKHQYVPIPELYMIAGQDGQLQLDYDWIIPEEDSLDFPPALFQTQEISHSFYQTLQLPSPLPPHPPQETTKFRPKISPLVVKSLKIQSDHRTYNNRENEQIVEDISSSPPLFSPPPTTQAPPVSSLSGKNRAECMVLDSGVGISALSGDALSEFIVPKCQAVPAAAVTTIPCSSNGSTSARSPVISMQMINQLSSSVGQAPIIYVNGQAMMIVPSQILSQAGSGVSSIGQLSEVQQVYSNTASPLSSSIPNQAFTLANYPQQFSTQSPRNVADDQRTVQYIQIPSSPSPSGVSFQSEGYFQQMQPTSVQEPKRALGRPSKASKAQRTTPNRSQNMSLLPKASPQNSRTAYVLPGNK